MANRFWVGGNSTWDATAGTKWATVSGGAGGSAVPTSADNVFLDNGAGTGNVTISGAVVCNNLDCTGYVNTLGGAAGNQITYSGTTFKLVPGMGCTFAGVITQATAAGTCLFTSAGKLAGGIQQLQPKGASTLQLQDNLDIGAGAIVFVAGSAGHTFDANNFNVNCSGVNALDGVAKTIKFGSGTWTISGAASGYFGEGVHTTVVAGTGTIKITGAGATFTGGGLTYPNLYCAVGAGNSMTIVDSNTFANVKIDPNTTLLETSGITVTATTLTSLGSAGNLATLNGSGGFGTLSIAAGNVNPNYMAIGNNHATGGASFMAFLSQNLGGNAGWLFAGGNANAIGGFF